MHHYYNYLLSLPFLVFLTVLLSLLSFVSFAKTILSKCKLLFLYTCPWVSQQCFFKKNHQVHEVLFPLILLAVFRQAVDPKPLSCCSVDVVFTFYLLNHYHSHVVLRVILSFERRLRSAPLRSARCPMNRSITRFCVFPT